MSEKIWGAGHNFEVMGLINLCRRRSGHCIQLNMEAKGWISVLHEAKASLGVS